MVTRGNALFFYVCTLEDNYKAVVLCTVARGTDNKNAEEPIMSNYRLRHDIARLLNYHSILRPG